MTEPQAEFRLAELYACACGMLTLFIAGQEREAARAAATIVLHLEPPEELRRRVYAEKGWPLFTSESVASMRALSRSVLMSRPGETSH